MSGELIKLSGDPNPYYGTQVRITKYGILELKDAVELKERQLLQHQFNLNWLKEYEAKYGEDLYLHNQIKAEETEVAKLEVEVHTLHEFTTGIVS